MGCKFTRRVRQDKAHGEGGGQKIRIEIEAGIDASRRDVIGEISLGVIRLHVAVALISGNLLSEVIANRALDRPDEVGADAESTDIALAGEIPFFADVPLRHGSR